MYYYYEERTTVEKMGVWRDETKLTTIVKTPNQLYVVPSAYSYTAIIEKLKDETQIKTLTVFYNETKGFGHVEIQSVLRHKGKTYRNFFDGLYADMVVFSKNPIDKWEEYDGDLGILRGFLTNFDKFDKKIAELDKKYLDPEYFYNRFFGPKLGDDTFKLKNGKLLVNNYGKYLPNLTFLLPDVKDQVNIYVGDSRKELKQRNITADGKAEVFYGNHFVSRKGTKVFDVKEPGHGEHILIVINWGGAFSKTRGRTNIPQKDIIWERNARSNGGGCGMHYIIVSKNYVVEMDENDI